MRGSRNRGNVRTFLRIFLLVVLVVPGLKLLGVAPWATALYFGVLTVGAIAIFRQPAPERERIEEDESADLLIEEALPKAEGYLPSASDSGPFAMARNAAVGDGIVTAVSRRAARSGDDAKRPDATARRSNLAELIGLLDSDREVSWSEVQRLVRGFPGFEGLIDLMLHPPAKATLWQPAMPEEKMFVSDSLRPILASNIRPHAILLESHEVPVECAARLEREAGVDPDAFLRQCLKDRTPEVAAAAEQVLGARSQQTTLLRAAKPTPGARPDDATALLRATNGRDAEGPK